MVFKKIKYILLDQNDIEIATKTRSDEIELSDKRSEYKQLKGK